GGHAAGGDGGLRLGGALEQAALDQQPIDANAASHANAPSADERVARLAPWGLIRPMEQITAVGCYFQPARCDPSRRAGVNPSSEGVERWHDDIHAALPRMSSAQCASANAEPSRAAEAEERSKAASRPSPS